MSNNPFQSPSPQSTKPSSNESLGGLVKAPAIAMIVAMSMYLLLALLGLTLNVLGIGLGAAGGAAGDPDGGMIMVQGTIGIISALFGICLSSFVIYGSVQMMNFKSYGIAMAAMIVGMLPCSFCCLLGLPFGIWGLVVLSKPEVKAAFN